MNWMNLNKKRRVCRKTLSGFATVQTENVVIDIIIFVVVAETWEAMLPTYLLHSLFLSSITYS